MRKFRQNIPKEIESLLIAAKNRNDAVIDITSRVILMRPPKTRDDVNSILIYLQGLSGNLQLSGTYHVLTGNDSGWQDIKAGIMLQYCALRLFGHTQSNHGPEDYWTVLLMVCGLYALDERTRFCWAVELLLKSRSAFYLSDQPSFVFDMLSYLYWVESGSEPNCPSKWTIPDNPYRQLVNAWNEFSDPKPALIAVCDYHINRIQPGSVEPSEEAFFPPFSALPLELLALKRFALDRNLPWIDLDHPVYRYKTMAIDLDNFYFELNSLEKYLREVCVRFIDWDTFLP
jgi:hypothetical protein